MSFAALMSRCQIVDPFSSSVTGSRLVFLTNCVFVDTITAEIWSGYAPCCCCCPCSSFFFVARLPAFACLCVMLSYWLVQLHLVACISCNISFCQHVYHLEIAGNIFRTFAMFYTHRRKRCHSFFFSSQK